MAKEPVRVMVEAVGVNTVVDLVEDMTDGIVRDVAVKTEHLTQMTLLVNKLMYLDLFYW